MDAVTRTCDICGEPIVDGGYMTCDWRAPECCTRPGCLEVWFIGLTAEDNVKPEGI